MNAHLTKVCEVVNLLQEIDVNIPEDVIIYSNLKNPPKEYEIFKKMQIATQTLPTYEEISIQMEV